MSRSKSLIVEIGCLVVGLIFYAIGKLASEIFLIPSVIIVVGGMILGLIFNRCPCCGRSLVRHHFFIEYCPYCGTCL